jgi:hypothetical protein
MKKAFFTIIATFIWINSLTAYKVKICTKDIPAASYYIFDNFDKTIKISTAIAVFLYAVGNSISNSITEKIKSYANKETELKNLSWYKNFIINHPRIISSIPATLIGTYLALGSLTTGTAQFFIFKNIWHYFKSKCSICDLEQITSK